MNQMDPSCGFYNLECQTDIEIRTHNSEDVYTFVSFLFATVGIPLLICLLYIIMWKRRQTNQQQQKDTTTKDISEIYDDTTKPTTSNHTKSLEHAEKSSKEKGVILSQKIKHVGTTQQCQKANVFCDEQEQSAPPKVIKTELCKDSKSLKKSLKKRLQVFARSARSTIKDIFCREDTNRPNKKERRQNPRRSRKSCCFLRRQRISTCFGREKGSTDNQTDFVYHDSHPTSEESKKIFYLFSNTRVVDQLSFRRMEHVLWK
ncbi:uncharacterized protein LOC143222740 [Tachypleus tridentatus]|uniref:uncharacterized protein LOC143222740 n=1 Tax=Tachypleus tridentatus TaxID=6853 RepID=UPI003FD00CA2